MTHQSLLRSRGRSTLYLLLVLAALAARPAHAAETARAKALYKEGKTNFELGKFPEAVKAWEEGYKETSNPEFLYNIGQAHRLAGDLPKALFFYKSYLRLLPRARNAAEVEEKITQLQAQIDAAARAAAPPVAPPPINASPAPAPLPRAEEGLSARAEGAPPLTAAGPLDLGVGAGLGGWLAGIGDQGGASFAAHVTGGFTFANAGNTRFRLGGAAGFAPFSDRPGSATFWSLLVVPGVVHTLRERFRLAGELGIGLVAVSGLGPRSALLDPTIIEVNGALARWEIRPAFSAAYRLTPGTSLYVSPALAVDGSRDKIFPSTLVRIELLIGASFHLDWPLTHRTAS